MPLERDGLPITQLKIEATRSNEVMIIDVKIQSYGLGLQRPQWSLPFSPSAKKVVTEKSGESDVKTSNPCSSMSSTSILTGVEDQY